MLITILITGVLYVSSFIVLGNSYPTITSNGQQIIKWFLDNAIRARFYAWTAAFISLGLAIAGGQLSALIPKPHRYIFLAGIFGFSITAQIQAWFWAGLALHPQSLDPSVARIIFDIPTYWGPLVNGSTATMAIAVFALGCGKSLVIPRWLTWLSAIFFLEQAIETITIFGQTGFIAPGGAMNVYLGGTIGFFWIAGVVYWAIQKMNSRDQAERSN